HGRQAVRAGVEPGPEHHHVPESVRYQAEDGVVEPAHPDRDHPVLATGRALRTVHRGVAVRPGERVRVRVVEEPVRPGRLAGPDRRDPLRGVHHAIMRSGPRVCEEPQPTMLVAVRRAMAMQVTIGFTPSAVGNTLVSPIHTPLTSCSSPVGLATLVSGSLPMRAPPIWWAEPR